MVCGSASSSTTKEWMTTSSSPKKGSSVFDVWPLTIGGKIAEKSAHVEQKVALEIITAFSMDWKTCLKPDDYVARVDEERHPVVPWEGVPVVTMTSCNAKTPTESKLFVTKCPSVDEG